MRERIGIWERHGDRYVRPPPLPFGDHHAAQEEIPAAKPPGGRRVCLFGESAAAGYLYAPHLTPARVLEHQLRAAGGLEWEVVDLARTNETLAGLEATFAAARRLAPDVAVIFTGNNWNLLETSEVSPYHPTAGGRQEYGATLSEGGVMGVAELAARRRMQRAAAALARIADRAAGLRVVLVVPEVNLADWEARQPPPWLPAGGNRRWHGIYGAAVGALGAGDAPEARRLAEQLLDLDDGVTPAPFRLVAAAGGGAVAADAEVAADHYASMCFLGAPRATPLDREVQRRAAAVHGFGLVDLPSVFRRVEAMPGRRLFLDYCHLTAAGMRLAMAAVAGEILGRPPPDGPGPTVAAAVAATARLGAAIHTAHRLAGVTPGSAGIVAHWLGAALDVDAGVETAMREVAAARAAPLPEVLTGAQVRNLDSPYRLGFQHGWRFPHLDGPLLAAIDRVLASRELAPLDLPPVGGELVRYGLWEPVARFYPEVMDFADTTPHAMLRCPWPTTAFGFVAGDEPEAVLSVTARAVHSAGTLRVEVGGRAAGTLALAAGWRTGRWRLPVRRGVNQLTLRWPELAPARPGGGAELEDAAGRLARGLPADIHPVFGEVYSVRVTTRT